MPEAALGSTPERHPAAHSEAAHSEAASERTGPTQRTTREASTDPLDGTTYRSIRPLGRGGQAQVLLARHTGLNQLCVVKLAHQTGEEDASSLERWLQEARILAQLDNPHVVRVLNTGRNSEGLPFIVLELLQGKTVQAALSARGKLPAAEVVELGSTVLRGLAAAHRAGVVHRDLKPENLFLHEPPEASSPTLKILDFGIAKIVADSGKRNALRPLDLTGHLQLVGTPRYLSPEQILQGAPVDARSDLYALGLILFVGLTGSGPFDHHRDVPSLLGAHLREPPEPVSAVFQRNQPGHTLPCAASFDRVVARALEKRPEDRYANAAEFLEALEALAAELAALSPFAPGDTVGSYRLSRPLLRGLDSETWQAQDTTLQRDARVQVLSPHATFGERFEAEARALAAVRHPSVVAVYDLGRTRGRPWAALQPPPGRPLLDWLVARGTAAALRVRLALAVVESAIEAERRGLVHGSLSPWTVYVSQEPDLAITLVDFGCLRGGAESGTAAARDHYRAPELEGRPGAATPRSEVYSLGRLVEALLLLPPAGSEPPSIQDPATGRGLQRVLRRALQPRPEARHPDALALGQALHNVLSEQPLPGASPRAVAWPLATRRRAIALGVALGTIAAAACANYVPGAWGQRSTKESRDVSFRDTLTP